MRCDAGTIARSVPASHARPPFLTSARPIFSNNKESARQPLLPRVDTVTLFYSHTATADLHAHGIALVQHVAIACARAHAVFLHPPSLPPTAAASIHPLDRLEGAGQWIASSSSQADRPATCTPACLCATSHPIAEPRAVHADPLYCLRCVLQSPDPSPRLKSSQIARTLAH